MNGKTLGDAIADLIIDGNAPSDQADRVRQQWEKIGSAIVDHITGNAEITVPAGQVIIKVAGQATGTPNSSPIQCPIT